MHAGLLAKPESRLHFSTTGHCPQCNIWICSFSYHRIQLVQILQVSFFSHNPLSTMHYLNTPSVTIELYIIHYPQCIIWTVTTKLYIIVIWAIGRHSFCPKFKKMVLSKATELTLLFTREQNRTYQKGTKQNSKRYTMLLDNLCVMLLSRRELNTETQGKTCLPWYFKVIFEVEILN
jgi:hypothetical protein